MTTIFQNITTIYWSIPIVLVTATLIWFYNYVRQHQSYWSRHGVPGPKPLFLFGTEYQLALESWPVLMKRRLKQYGKIYGAFQILRPFLFIHDHELIKQVMIKDFHYFVNRIPIRTYHEMANENLFFAEGERWKRMRSIASPSFTTGKLRNMVPLMSNCMDKLFKYFDRTIQQNNGVIETKKVIAGFTMDVIASAGFNTETNANDDRQKESQFLKNGLQLFQTSLLNMLASFALPRFMLNLLNIRTLSPWKPFKYFINLTSEIIRQRKNDKKKHNDLLQLMLDAQIDENEFNENNYDKLTASMDEHETVANGQANGHNSQLKNVKKMTDNEVIANSIIFLLAGFETTSSTIAHFMFEMAWNPQIQDRLYQNLVEELKDKEINSKEYYDTIMQGIPYFEACLKETLRRYPPVNMVSRRVNIDGYKLNGIPLMKDTVVIAPVNVIHHSEEYYERPYHFIPDRWMPENKDKLVPYTFLPFGLGPRNCIGMRFAYQEIKLCLARMLMKYRLETTDETPRELTSRPRVPILATNPFKLQIVKRDESSN